MTETPRTDEQPRIALHECIDMEQHARSFNEGYEAAMVHHLADDPTVASDWLDEHDRKVRAAVLAEAEERIWDLRVGTDHMVGKAWLAEARSVVFALRAEVESRG